ncbi:MAG: glycosyltransferase family 39 protein [Candidatus Riflebacteria bacterium]|nr:glycosyltransferase family 39 protein [Candidatus Riflebacteria bacterium]
MAAPPVQPESNAGSSIFSNRAIEISILVFIILMGGLLRLYHLGQKSFSPDEAAAFWLASGNFLTIPSLAISNNQNPLFYFLLSLWQHAFGRSEEALRCLPVLFGIASIAAIYLMGKRMMNASTGLIASLLLSVALYHIHISQECRTYSLLTFFCLISMYSFWGIQKESIALDSWLYIISSIILVLAHNFGAMIPVAQNCFILIYWGRSFWSSPFRNRWLWIQASLILLLGLWGVVIVKQFSAFEGGGFLDWISLPTISTVLMIFLQYCGATTICNGLASLDQRDNTPALLMVFMIVFTGLCGLITVKRSHATEGQDEKKPLLTILENQSWELRFKNVKIHLLLFCWMAVPMLIPFLVSQVSAHIFCPKPLSFCSLSLILWAAIGIDRIQREIIKVSVLGILLILSWGCIDQFFSAQTECEWRDATAFIESKASQNDLIYFDILYGHYSYDYYSKRNDLEMKPFPFQNYELTQECARQISSECRQKKGIWLVISNSFDEKRYGLTFMKNIRRPTIEEHFFGIDLYFFPP